MRGQQGSLQRFVRQLHRRLKLVRLAERVGLCAGVACLAGVVLELLLIWRGQSAWGVCLTTLAGGCLTGMVWGLVVGPTRLEAAMEADRQLHLQDLLSTAYLLKNPQTNPWEQTVVALAQAKCQRTSPSAVVLKRWGGRAWSGVGLAALMVVVLAFFPPPVAQSANNSSAVSFARNDGSKNDLYENGSLLADKSAMPWAVPARPEEERSLGQETTNQIPDGQQPTASAADNRADNSPATPSAFRGGTGPNSAETSHAPIKPPPSASNPGSMPPSHPDANVGAPAAGVGLPTGKAISSQQARSMSANPAIVGHPAPPWQTSAWPQQQAAALQAIQQGRVPDQYRQLVRDYFKRE